MYIFSESGDVTFRVASSKRMAVNNYHHFYMYMYMYMYLHA